MCSHCCCVSGCEAVCVQIAYVDCVLTVDVFSLFRV